MPAGYGSTDGCLYGTKFSTIILPNNLTEIPSYAFYGSSLSSITIPKNVTKIGAYAFANCKSMSGNLYIPDLVTEIALNAFNKCTFDGRLLFGSGLLTVGSSAFEGCSGF